MKNKITLSNYYEFFLGMLLTDDEFYKENRKNIKINMFLESNINELCLILYEKSNLIEDIYKINKKLAIYAMELANHAQHHIIGLKENKYLNKEFIK